MTNKELKVAKGRKLKPSKYQMNKIHVFHLSVFPWGRGLPYQKDGDR